MFNLPTEEIVKLKPMERIKHIKWYYKILLPLGAVVGFMRLYAEGAVLFGG